MALALVAALERATIVASVGQVIVPQILAPAPATSAGEGPNSLVMGVIFPPHHHKLLIGLPAVEDTADLAAREVHPSPGLFSG